MTDKVSDVNTLGVYLIIAALIVVLGLVVINERNISLTRDAAQAATEALQSSPYTPPGQ